MNRGTPSHVLAAVAALGVAGCAQFWADSIASQVAADYAKISAYEGEIVETGILDVDVVKKLAFQSPWQLRLEVVQPRTRAGELVVFDGRTLILWSPQSRIGSRISGITIPTGGKVFEHIRRRTKSNLDSYAFSMRGRSQIAGQPTKTWHVIPTVDEPFRFEHSVWSHRDYSITLAMDFPTRQGPSWYAFGYRRLAFVDSLPSSTFQFRFPQDAIVLEWNLAGPHLTSQRARVLLGERIAEPKYLPKGHALQRRVMSESLVPMVATVFNYDASLLILTQAKRVDPKHFLLSKAITLASGGAAYLTFVGEFVVLTWNRGNSTFTLTRNLSFPQVIRVADSVR